jgi:hypothetical protein
MSPPLQVSYVVLWVLVVVLVVAVIALYHHFGQMYLGTPEGRQQQGPQVGTVLEPQRARDLSGRQWLIPAEDAGLLLFMSTDCAICVSVMEQLPMFLERAGTLPTIVLAGERARVAAWAARVDGEVPVVFDRNHRLAARLKIAMTPFLVGIGPGREVLFRGLFNDIDGLNLALDELEVVLAATRVTDVSAVPGRVLAHSKEG